MMNEQTFEEETKNLQEKFLAQFEQHVDSTYEPEMLRKKKLRAWDHLQELGLPDTSNEAFRYLKLNPLYTTEYTCADAYEIKKRDLLQYRIPESESSFLVFANGAFRPELSDYSSLKEAILMPISQALRQYSSLLQSAWAKSLKEEMDPFATLNNACHQEGLFLYIPPNKKIQGQIQLLHILDSEGPTWTMPRIYIAMGKCSEASFVETSTQITPNRNLFDNRVVEFLLEDGSICNYSQFIHNFHGKLFSAVRATVKRDAKFSQTSIADTEFSRTSLRVQLVGEGSNASLHGVNMLSSNNQAHTHVVIDHQEPNCQSMQLFKNVLQDQSCSSFEGKIWVRQKAQKTQAYQLNNNLVLSNNATALSKPNLEIFADDVKASHGATSGQLDNEQLFYLRSRGLSIEAAKACLIQGFCQEIVNLVPSSAMREAAHKLIIQLYGS